MMHLRSATMEARATHSDSRGGGDSEISPPFPPLRALELKISQENYALCL